jgi:hypothetical protein
MRYRPPPKKAQGRDFEHSRQAELEALPKSTLTPQNYSLPLSSGKGSSICCYCHDEITHDDDAQRVNKRIAAHTRCAFAVDHEAWAGLDVMETKTRKPRSVTLRGFLNCAGEHGRNNYD